MKGLIETAPLVSEQIPGHIVDVKVKEGESVKAGDVVLILEAMKMENEIPAPIAGTVKAVHVKAGDKVDMNALLIEIE